MGFCGGDNDENEAELREQRNDLRLKNAELRAENAELRAQLASLEHAVRWHVELCGDRSLARALEAASKGGATP